MNDRDIRQKLRAMRIPGGGTGQRDDILDAALEALNQCCEPNIAIPPASSSWTWRDWLWPSPIAWGAMAVVWAIALAQGLSQSSDSPQFVGNEPARTFDQNPFGREPLTADADFQRLLEESGSSRAYP